MKPNDRIVNRIHRGRVIGRGNKPCPIWGFRLPNTFLNGSMWLIKKIDSHLSLIWTEITPIIQLNWHYQNRSSNFWLRAHTQVPILPGLWSLWLRLRRHESQAWSKIFFSESQIQSELVTTQLDKCQPLIYIVILSRINHRAFSNLPLLYCIHKRH